MEKITPNWQNLPSNIDPVAFYLGDFPVLWYSLCYILVISTFLSLVHLRIKKKELAIYFENQDHPSPQAIFDLLLTAGISGIASARIGYVLFYDLNYFILHPSEIFLPIKNGVWTGLSGMSFYGGLIGALAFSYYSCKKKHINFLKLANFVIPAFPLAYFWGRIGNFLNGELFGRTTELQIGMFFPLDNLQALRHPSQLYEALGEGLLVFAIMWLTRNHPKLKDKQLAMFIGLYGLTRFLIEFTREPDMQLGLIWGIFSLNQIISLLAITVSAIFMTKNISKHKSIKNNNPL